MLDKINFFILYFLKHGKVVAIIKQLMNIIPNSGSSK